MSNLKKKPVEKSEKKFISELGLNTIFEAKVLELLEEISQNTKK